MPKEDFKHVKVYTDYSSNGQEFYIRLLGKQTKRFPHGISLGTTFKNREAAVEFAGAVDEYIEESFCSK